MIVRDKSKVCYGKEEINMEIKKGDNSVNIPAWAIILGLLVVDNIAVNVCKAVSYKNLTNVLKKEES